MNVQITGSRGLLGSAVFEAFGRAGHTVQSASFDIAEVQSWDITAPLVINCAGIVKQRDLPVVRFAQVNAYAPHRLAEVCDQSGARLIHISTDCVFGLLSGPSTELAIPCPEDLYGATKLAGEVIRPPHLTVRTSFVGPGRRGLWADIAAGVPQRASTKMLWSGHTTETVAERLVQLAETQLSGRLHLPGVAIDRLHLVQLIADTLGVEPIVERDDGYVRDRRLASVRTSEAGLPEPLPIAEQLARLPVGMGLETDSSL